MKLELELQKVMAQWLSEKKGRSLRLLSRKSGLSYPTILRMSKADGSFINANILKVLQALFPKAKDFRVFVSDHMPEYLELADEYSKADVQFVSPNQVSPIMVRIWRELCFGSCTEDEIFKIFGMSGKMAVERLVESKIVIRNEGKLELAHEAQHMNSIEFIRELIKQVADNLDFNVRGNIAHLANEGLNLQGSIAAYELVEKFVLDINKIRLNPEFKGDRKVAISALMTIF